MWNFQRRRAALAATVSAAVISSAAPTAASSDIGSIASQPTDLWTNVTVALATKRTADRPDKNKTARTDKTPVIPPGPLQIVVSTNTQRVKLYANGQEVAQAPVSTGTASHPTPMGLFSIIQKNRHHVSNLYGAAMPYMQRITWSGSAMHQGPLPGYPASHGCIRLPVDFAAMLWKTTKLGARVVIAKDETRPVDINIRAVGPKPAARRRVATAGQDRRRHSPRCRASRCRTPPARSPPSVPRPRRAPRRPAIRRAADDRERRRNQATSRGSGQEAGASTSSDPRRSRAERARPAAPHQPGFGVRQPQGWPALRPQAMEPLFDAPVTIQNPIS